MQVPGCGSGECSHVVERPLHSQIWQGAASVRVPRRKAVSRKKGRQRSQLAPSVLWSHWQVAIATNALASDGSTACAAWPKQATRPVTLISRTANADRIPMSDSPGGGGGRGWKERAIAGRERNPAQRTAQPDAHAHSNRSLVPFPSSPFQIKPAEAEGNCRVAYQHRQAGLGGSAGGWPS